MCLTEIDLDRGRESRHGRASHGPIRFVSHCTAIRKKGKRRQAARFNHQVCFRERTIYTHTHFLVSLFGIYSTASLILKQLRLLDSAVISIVVAAAYAGAQRGGENEITRAQQQQSVN